MAHKKIILAITGASGGPYAVRLLDCLVESGAEVHVIVSTMGSQLLSDECGLKELTVEAMLGRPCENVTIHACDNMNSPLASGSCLTDAMVICPCSSNTLGAVASGLGSNLITRAAAVTLKEARRLVVVPREMPVSGIDLSNMLRLQQAGAVICPASPGFYMKPQTVEDMIDFVVGKLLDLVGIEHSLNTRWTPGDDAGDLAGE